MEQRVRNLEAQLGVCDDEGHAAERAYTEARRATEAAQKALLTAFVHA